MRIEQITQACQIAQAQKRVFLVTASSSGSPHLTTACQLICTQSEEVVVSDWFCPRTVGNIQENPMISLVAYDAAANHGYQLIGLVVAQTPSAIMDGYEPSLEQKEPLPQVMRELRIRVQEVLEFRHGPHADLEPM